MVNGPPCGVCGFTLRWLPQQNGWGCDRCQRMFPASGPGAPHAATPSPYAQPPGHAPSPYAPQPQGFAPPQPQGFAPPQQQGFRPPQQQGFAPQQPSPYAPPAHPQPSPYAQPQQASYPSQPAPYGAPPAGGPPPGAPPHAGYGPQPQPPHQPYSPQPHSAPATPAPATGKKSSKGLVIGLAVAGVAIAGGIVAFVMMRGGGDPKGGDSRETVVKATLAALGEGDVDRLLALSDPMGLYAKVVDCTGKTKPRDPDHADQKPPKDPEEEAREERDKLKKKFGELVEKTKGGKFELVEIVTKEPPPPSDDESDSDSGDSRLLKTGARAEEGCFVRMPVRIAEARVKIKVTPPPDPDAKDAKPEADEQEIELKMMQVGKGWWLLRAPRISLGAGALSKAMRDMRDKVCACKDYDCARKLKDDFKSSPQSQEFEKAAKDLSPEDEEKLEKIEDEIKECENKLAGEQQLGALTQFKDRVCACTDKVCADKVLQEMSVWSKSQDHTRLSEDVRQKATDISKAMADCMAKLYSSNDSGGGIGDTIATVAGSEADAPIPGLPAACEEYRLIIQRMAACEKIPQQSRDGLKQAYESMSQGWKNMGNLPPEAKQSIENTCQQAVKAMQQSATTMGC